MLSAGDSFSLDGITENIPIEPTQDATLLYVSNKPQFDGMADYQGNLNELMRLVDAKDHYTYRHSELPEGAIVSYAISDIRAGKSPRAG